MAAMTQKPNSNIKVDLLLIDKTHQDGVNDAEY